MLPIVTDSPWHIVKNSYKSKEKSKTPFMTNFVPVTPVTLKRKLDEDIEQQSKVPKAKKQRMLTDPAIQSPLGFKWDSDHYSCAYDALLTVLLSIWMQDPPKWKRMFKDMNRIMNVLASGFYIASQNQGTLESARNKVRRLLHQRSPVVFPYGHSGTPAVELAEQLLRSDRIIASSWLKCINCAEETNRDVDLQTCVIQCTGDLSCTTSVYLQKKFLERHPRRRCGHCDGEVDQITRFEVVPKVLIFANNGASIKASKKIAFMMMKNG
jgi:hypothetical protein